MFIFDDVNESGSDELEKIPLCRLLGHFEPQSSQEALLPDVDNLIFDDSDDADDEELYGECLA